MLLPVESAEVNRNWPSEMNILMLLLMQPDLQGGEMKLYAFNINNFVQNSMESSLHLHRNNFHLQNKACLCITRNLGKFFDRGLLVSGFFSSSP